MEKYSEIASMIRDAERHADDQHKDRLRAIEYYQGRMTDTPAEDGRSKMVSRDVRAMIKKVLPALIRTILGSDVLGEFDPVGPGDERAAEQSTDYLNRVIVPECGIRQVLEDAIHDALLLRNGILSWKWQEKQMSSVSRHSGLDEYAFAELVSDDEVEVLEHSERQELVEAQDGSAVPVMLHDVKIRRVTVHRSVKVRCVPRERFLIHPDAQVIDDSILTGERMELTRSDLIAMGYDRDLIEGLQRSDDDDLEIDERRDRPRDDDEVHRPNELVDYYDVYVRHDSDGDGIAELRHMCFAGGLHERNVLMDEEADEIQYCDIRVMSQPHQWEGISVADDLMDIQQVKTVLLRQTLDNIYWTNNPQPVIQGDMIENPEAVFNPEFGLPIEVKKGANVRDAYTVNQVPFVADNSFAMMEYMDQEAADRTGITDASAGLAPDALQNMTAKASGMIEAAGIGQTELMVRTAAEGIRRLFRGLLRLIVRHQDIPRTVRLRGEWVEYDPRHWNAAMDFSVNVGLGAGTRERDMMMMRMILDMQERLLTAFGPDNPFVKPDDIWNALSRMVESAGLRTPDIYFTEPDPQEVQAKLEAARGQPNPEMAKIEATRMVEEAKQQTQRQREAAQLEADMVMERMRIDAERERHRMDRDADLEKQARQHAHERQMKEFDAQMQAAAAVREPHALA